MAEHLRRDTASAGSGINRTSARRVLIAAFTAALAGAFTLVLGAVLLAKGGAEGWWALAIAGGAACAIGCWIGYETTKEHFQALDRLRGFAVAMRAAGGGGPINGPPVGDRESAALRDAMIDALNARDMQRAAGDKQLAAILANLPDAVVVVTARGQVSLLNSPAKSLLGAERAALGTSLFDAVSRDSLIAAWNDARRTGRPAQTRLGLTAGGAVQATVADLGAQAGALIVIPAPDAPHVEATLDHDLSLHEAPPAAPPPDRSTALNDLPLAALDTETTGLVPAADRIVALGGVRLHGATIYRATALDRLVHPGVPVPPRASAIHGLTDAMLADAPAFPAHLDALRDLTDGAVPVGHNIGFDMTIIDAECRRAAIAWTPPAFTLCTLQLAAALDPQEENLDLEAVAVRHGLDPLGRHSALGDSLLTAALWQRMLPRLQERGIATLGQALDFAQSAKRVIAFQKTAGW